MKKFISVLLCLFMFAQYLFAAESKEIVAVSILPQVEIVSRIAGDKVKIICLVPKGSDPHSYEPSPSVLKAFSKAKVWFQVGSGIEFEQNWAGALIKQNPSVSVVDTSDGIQTIDGDPHVWLLPRNVVLMATNTLKGLVSILPDEKDSMLENATRYMDELIKADKRIIQSVKKNSISGFVAQRPAWLYFARAYLIKYIPILLSGRQASAKQVKDLINEIKKEKISYLFIDSKTPVVRSIEQQVKLKEVYVTPLTDNLLGQFKLIADEFSGEGNGG